MTKKVNTNTAMMSCEHTGLHERPEDATTSASHIITFEESSCMRTPRIPGVEFFGANFSQIATSKDDVIDLIFDFSGIALYELAFGSITARKRSSS